MMNASATGPAPRIAASMMSRSNPVTRDTSVRPPTVIMWRSMGEPWVGKAKRAHRNLRIDSGTLRHLRPNGGHAGLVFLADLRPDRAPNGRNNVVLGGLVEVGVHRQADDLLGNVVGHRQPAFVGRKMAVGFLAMQRLWVVDRGRNALCLEGGGESVPGPGLGADGVLRPHRGHIAWHPRYS